MKLIGNLKKQVDQTESREEARSLIEKAGMLLEDDELENVAGGIDWESIFGTSGPSGPAPRPRPASGDAGHFFDD